MEHVAKKKGVGMKPYHRKRLIFKDYVARRLESPKSTVGKFPHRRVHDPHFPKQALLFWNGSGDPSSFGVIAVRIPRGELYRSYQ
jgi:hypothetical protein